MESLTEAEIAKLQSFAGYLSTPAMPVRIEYAPPYITVHAKRPGLSNTVGRDLVISAYPTLEQLKAAIKKEAGVV